MIDIGQELPRKRRSYEVYGVYCLKVKPAMPKEYCWLRYQYLFYKEKTT